MHIELKARMAGPAGNFPAGHVLTVGEEISEKGAGVLLLAGAARQVEDPAIALAGSQAEKVAADEGEPETATAEPAGETTAKPRPSRRKKKAVAKPRRRKSGDK